MVLQVFTITTLYQLVTTTLGTLTVHGHGGSNSAAALDTTAAGDFWDNTLGIGTATVVQGYSSSICKWKWSSCLLSTFSG